MELKRQEETHCAQSPTLSKKALFEVGAMYEIDPTNLPTLASDQLRSIRVITVNGKTESAVSVRFPTVDTVRTYFICGLRMLCPSFTQTFVMDNILAGKVLCRMITSEEFKERKTLDSFWFHSITIGVFGEMIPKEGGFYLEQNSKGALRVVPCPRKIATFNNEEVDDEEEEEEEEEEIRSVEKAKKVKREEWLGGDGGEMRDEEVATMKREKKSFPVEVVGDGSSGKNAPSTEATYMTVVQGDAPSPTAYDSCCG